MQSSTFRSGNCVLVFTKRRFDYAARFTNIDGVYRLFLLKGTAVPTVRNTRGAMVNVKIDTPVLELVKEIAEQGMSHHYSLVWEDVAEQMELVANLFIFQ